MYCSLEQCNSQKELIQDLLRKAPYVQESFCCHHTLDNLPEMLQLLSQVNQLANLRRKVSSGENERKLIPVDKRRGTGGINNVFRV